MDERKQSLDGLLATVPQIKRCGQLKPEEQLLISSHPRLNALLQGGMRFGELIEWGMPRGRGGREIIALFLAQATRAASQPQDPDATDSSWCLWVTSDPDFVVYPPAWVARGVDLSHMRFACSKRILDELKPVFLDPFFKVIVLDDPRRLTAGDYSFLAHQARVHQQLIMILRNHFLTIRRGNVWAHVRLNGWYDAFSSRFFLQMIKGGHLRCRGGVCSRSPFLQEGDDNDQ